MEGPANVTVIGAGAVGSYFGGMLARSGARVTYVGRPGRRSPHLEALDRHGLRIDGVVVNETVPVTVAEGPEAVAGADLVLFCVKAMDNEVAARAMAPHLEDGAWVLSLQNGVDNVERLAAVGVEAMPAVVFVAAEIEEPGAIRHRGRGDLILDAADDGAAETISAWFEAAGVPCPVSGDFARLQWTKLVINAMANAISALAGSSYKAMADYEPTWQLALAAAREATEVANRAGVAVDLDEVVATATGIVGAIGDATSSTEQDLARGRPTEIQSLNGVISRKGAELGVPTPTHDALTALVGLRERLATGSHHH